MSDPSPDTPLDGSVRIPKNPEARARLGAVEQWCAAMATEDAARTRQGLERVGDRPMSSPDTPNVCPTCDDTGLVAPLGGRGSDGPDPCPHCTPAAGSPSPDVAALAERLRDDGLRARHHDEVLTADDACRWGGVGALLWAEDMIEAADALEAQAEELDENIRVIRLLRYQRDKAKDQAEAQADWITDLEAVLKAARAVLAVDDLFSTDCHHGDLERAILALEEAVDAVPEVTGS